MTTTTTTTRLSLAEDASCLALGPVPLVCLEGNISAGKSTLSRALAKRGCFRVFLEPTVRNPFLEKFYADPAQYALRMQIWLLRQRFFTYVKAVRHALETGEPVILDRSIFSDWVFAKKNHDDGQFDDQAFSFYSRLRSRMLESLPLPSVVYYLDVTPSECLERIHEIRGRDCESGIPIEYLSGLDSAYELLLHSLDEAGCKVIRKNWNDFGEEENAGSEILEYLSKTRSSRTIDVCINDLRKKIYDDRWVRSILYSVEDIDSSLQFADDLLSDIQLPLIDGDDPEDEIALGSSDNLFDSDERSDPDEYDADVSMSSIRTLDYPPSPCTSLPDEDDFVSLKTSSVCC